MLSQPRSKDHAMLAQTKGRAKSSGVEGQAEQICYNGQEESTQVEESKLVGSH